jgi:hypothetical protein
MHVRIILGHFPRKRVTIVLQTFSIPPRTFLSPSLISCNALRDVILTEGDFLGSSSSSMTFEAAGVTTRCRLVPLTFVMLEIERMVLTAAFSFWQLSDNSRLS